jgi:hypothetical protein
MKTVAGGISKTQIALAYAPGLSASAARKRLSQWLLTHPKLMTELVATGYIASARVFTPSQVKIIFKHLGEP